MTLWRCPYCRMPLLTQQQRVLHLADPRGCSRRPAQRLPPDAEQAEVADVRSEDVADHVPDDEPPAGARSAKPTGAGGRTR